MTDLRRWFRFSLRDAALMVAIVAMGIGWWCDHTRLAHRIEAVEQEAEQARKEATVWKSSTQALLPKP